MDRIANGHTEDFFYLGGLWDTMKTAGKGGVIGAATGGAGMPAKAGAAALGASAPLASTAGVAAEAKTVRLPGISRRQANEGGSRMTFEEEKSVIFLIGLTLAGAAI
ncbi:MAG: hypothetical protein LBU06_05715 [Desulfovibrio sp.]|jgi:hypothetical protein|nr:hypothetical protein [Desulfovibrio sp.]